MNGLQPRSEGKMVSEREHARQNCEIIGHRWIEEYYGYTCENCGEFIPYGCEPWGDPADADDPDLDIDHVCECGRPATDTCTLCGLPMCSMCFECSGGVCDYHRGD